MTSPTDAGFRRGIRIGVDVGSVRVGVARTDPDGRLAVPVATLTRPAGRWGARRWRPLGGWTRWW